MSTMTKNKTNIITMRVSDGLQKQLESLAQSIDRSKSYIAEQALSEYLEENAWLIKEAQIGIKDVEEGRVITEKEMKAFFKKLKSDIRKRK